MIVPELRKRGETKYECAITQSQARGTECSAERLGKSLTHHGKSDVSKGMQL